VAKISGLLSIPKALPSIFVSLAAYVPLTLTEKFGEKMIVLPCCALSCVVLSLFGMTTSIWQLATLQFFLGLPDVCIVPCVGPVISRHAKVFYSNDMALAQAIPLWGSFVGVASGQVIVATILETSNNFWERTNWAWLFLGIQMLVCGVTFYVAVKLVDRQAASLALLVRLIVLSGFRQPLSALKSQGLPTAAYFLLIIANVG